MTITSGIEPGDKAPHFKLKNANPSISGEWVSFSESMAENGLIVMFTCNHCPYVKAIMSRLVRDVNELKKFGINAIAISSNDVVNYPEDSFENMKLLAKENHFEFPYVFDETQEIAKAYDAICTPDFFGLNAELRLQYRGRLDDLKMGASGERNAELLEAMRQIAKTGAGPAAQTPSVGCSIKWRRE